MLVLVNYYDASNLISRHVKGWRTYYQTVLIIIMRCHLDSCLCDRFRHHLYSDQRLRFRRRPIKYFRKILSQLLLLFNFNHQNSIDLLHSDVPSANPDTLHKIKMLYVFSARTENEIALIEAYKNWICLILLLCL